MNQNDVLASRNDRLHRLQPTTETDPRDPRSPGRRDRDRILYSSAFRRLSGITQVAAPTERFLIHNRLTHTLEVAQIGRSLAENLRARYSNELADAGGGIDPDVVEAAALAHDLGHPPFGHVAERELDDLVKKDHDVADGFEGNAQSFRIVTKLAVRNAESEGLDLTRATLCAMLKYPWMRGTTGKKSRKWGAYGSEHRELAWAREACPLAPDSKSIEAALMDWADDVAYAVHDLEDFFRAGLIPLDRLATDQAERDRFLREQLTSLQDDSRFSNDDLASAFDGLMEIAPFSERYSGRRHDRAGLRSFTSELIDQYVNAVSLSETSAADSPLVIDPKAEMEVIMLKGLTWHYVIESRSLFTQRYGQRKLIRSLFEILSEAAATEADWHIFPAIYQEALRTATGEDERVRVVADLIASMSESQVVEIHHRLTGLSLGSAMDPVLP